MRAHVVGQIELTSIEAEHILTALRGFYADQDAWCEVCSEIAKKVLPIAQADGFLKDWEILDTGEYKWAQPKSMGPGHFLAGSGHSS